ncbi:MAG: hypothetical protein EP297_12815 [Gammaproteobacteria bacterium]|nr:MAG: hypothetical protein EP297_12815 [Gammaproteobacteria bacterium]
MQTSNASAFQRLRAVVHVSNMDILHAASMETCKRVSASPYFTALREKTLSVQGYYQMLNHLSIFYDALDQAINGFLEKDKSMNHMKHHLCASILKDDIKHLSECLQYEQDSSVAEASAWNTIHIPAITSKAQLLGYLYAYRLPTCEASFLMYDNAGELLTRSDSLGRRFLAHSERYLHRYELAIAINDTNDSVTVIDACENLLNLIDGHLQALPVRN